MSAIIWEDMYPAEGLFDEQETTLRRTTTADVFELRGVDSYVDGDGVAGVLLTRDELLGMARAVLDVLGDPEPHVSGREDEI